MQKVKCDNCGQYKLIRNSDLNATAGVVMFFLGIPLTALLIGIPMMVLGPCLFIFGIIQRFTKLDHYSCQNCKKKFSKEEFSVLKA